MSDLLIKSMEMYEGCVECPLLLAYGSRLENKIIHHCMGRLPEDSRFSDDADLTKRPKEGCPLVEVKPHGELIDKDAVLDILRTYLRMVPIDTDIANRVYEIVYEAPTVLEASK